MYEQELKKAIKILNIKNQKVLLQLPEGLWIYLLDIIKILETKGNDVFWFLGKSYGACDLPLEEAKKLRCNVILHVGHAPFLKEKVIEGIRIEYVELFVYYDVNKIVELLKKHSIIEGVLVGHLPFTKPFPQIVEKAKTEGINLELKNHEFLSHPGQILGCNIVNALTDKNTIIYIGDGSFHIYGLYSLNKRILAINPITWDVRDISKEEQQKYIRKKYVVYTAIKQSERLGVIISSKPGQFEVFAKHIIAEVKKEFQEKTLIFIVANEIKKEDLEFLKVDAFINLACPRLEDDKDFPKPVLSWKSYLEVKSMERK